MKAAVFNSPGQLEVQDLPLPEPVPGEVRIKVLGCGVCGTDAHIYAGDIRNAKPPVVLGHEIYGRVDKLTETVGGFQIGDPVIVDPFIFCGTCDSCKRGEYRFCERETFVGYHRQGGFAQYTCVPQANIYKIAAGVGAKEAVLAETLATVVAGLSRLQPEAGRSALILGAGAVGLIWNVLRNRCLAVTLIQSEPVPMRRAEAEALGADLALSPQEADLEGEVWRLCPKGVDYLIDASGSTAAIEQALPLLRRGGTFLSFGICPEEQRLSLSLNWFYHRQARILTSRRPPREMQRAIELLQSGRLALSHLVTGTYPLAEIETSFRRFTEARDREIKMMIDPWM